MNPHQIRLRGPWRYRVNSAGLPLPEKTMNIPCLIPEMPEGSGFRISRNLGRPGNLVEGESVYLVIAKPGFEFKVFWNHREIGCTLMNESFEFRIDGMMLGRNLLEMDGVASRGRVPLFEETYLEIRFSSPGSLP